jgi:uncharacterized membrane protein
MFAVLRTERQWPWTDDALGWTGLFVVAGILVLLTLWTYAGTRKIGWRRLAGVLLLRLAALAIAVLLLVRPFFANERELLNDGQLLLILDYSSSMRITDGPGNQSRWDTVQQLLEWPEIKEAFAQLQRAKNIKIFRYLGAEDVRPYDPATEPNGTRTDIGTWLHALRVKHKDDSNLRGLLVISDGQNNGTSFSAVNVANDWRGLRCPIHCIGVGSPKTTKGQRDIAVVNVDAPSHAFFKSPVRIKAIVDAPNLEGQLVTVRLLVEGKDIGVTKQVTLPKTRGNPIDVGEFVPDRVGEVKVTVKIDEVPGEFTKLNNEMSTYVNVTKEGISVLWIEGRQRLEATWIIRFVLQPDARFNVLFDERLAGNPVTTAQKALVDFKNKPYDVVVIGDISAQRFSGDDKAVFAQLREMVLRKRAGLLVLGGFNTLNDDQEPTATQELADILPVELVKQLGEIEDKVQAQPVAANKGHPLLQVGDVWHENIFGKLDGLPRLGPARGGSALLLEGENKEPVMAVTGEDLGRIVALAADTTHDCWYRNDDAVRAYKRFWHQLFVWLARQEKGDDQLRVELDKRRLAAGSNERLGFTVKLLDKQGREVKNATYKVHLIPPQGKPTAVETKLASGLERGKIGPVSAAGEYQVAVTGEGMGSDGKPIKVDRAVTARFEGFAEDVENQFPAANHKFLEDVAAAGAGSFRIAGKDELLQLLNELREKTAAPGWVQTDAWPNWKATPASDGWFDQLAALWQSGEMVSFTLFMLVICTEWFLRRWWGLV